MGFSKQKKTSLPHGISLARALLGVSMEISSDRVGQSCHICLCSETLIFDACVAKDQGTLQKSLGNAHVSLISYGVVK